MAGVVKHAKLTSRTARSGLKRFGRQPHWHAIIPGRAALGYQRWKGDPEGRWVLRRYIGPRTTKKGKRSAKYLVMALGRADDAVDANNADVLSFEQADAKARSMIDVPAAKEHNLTVRRAMELYVEFKRHSGQSVADVMSRGTAHILPTLGDLVVSKLTAKQLRQWLYTMASAPAQVRPKKGKPQFKPEPVGDEAIRKRKATANRVLTMLKAM